MRTLDKGRSSARITQLSPRELQILNLVADGQTNPEIAAVTGTEVGTVTTQVSMLLQGLAVRNRTELTGLAYRHEGLLTHGHIALGPHPRGCTCGFAYCPEHPAALRVRIDSTERLGAMAR